MQLYQDLGFGNVQSYIQSGNVVFTSDNANAGQLSDQIKNAIKGCFSFTVDVLVKTPADFQRIIQQNPFEAHKTYVTFLWHAPTAVPDEKIKNACLPGEEVKVVGNAIYFSCPQNYGTPKTTTRLP